MSREQLYAKLKKQVGKTKLELIDNTEINVPNGNKIYIKRECDNLFGSHYDRVYLGLFEQYEQKGLIKPGCKVFETSSGTAGASFAGIAKELGYEAHIAIPEGVDDAVIKVIEEYGAKIYFTPEKDYIAGFPKFLKEFRPWDKGFVFLNHSMGRKVDVGYQDNDITLDAMGNIAKEIKKELNNKVDYYIPAVGNGSSILGPGREFGKETKIVCFESFQSAVAYNFLYPNKYETEFGIRPGTLPKHKLRGTSYHGVDFPHIKHAFEEHLINDVYLVSDKEQDANYKKITKRTDSEALPHWDSIRYKDYGRSTRAGLAVALKLSETIKDKTLVIIGYDKANRYDY